MDTSYYDLTVYPAHKKYFLSGKYKTTYDTTIYEKVAACTIKTIIDSVYDTTYYVKRNAYDSVKIIPADIRWTTEKHPIKAGYTRWVIDRIHRQKVIIQEEFIDHVYESFKVQYLKKLARVEKKHVPQYERFYVTKRYIVEEKVIPAVEDTLIKINVKPPLYDSTSIPDSSIEVSMIKVTNRTTARVLKTGKKRTDISKGGGFVTIHYDSDRTFIKPKYHNEIYEKLAKPLLDSASLRVLIESHTDHKRPNAWPNNQVLSDARSKALKDHLVNTYHIDSNRIRTVGYGESNQVNDCFERRNRADSCTDKKLEENRRSLFKWE